MLFSRHLLQLNRSSSKINIYKTAIQFLDYMLSYTKILQTQIINIKFYFNQIRNMRAIKYAFSSTIGRDVFIVAARRTPIGSFTGSLSHLQAPQLGGIAIKGALDSIKLSPKEVNEVILGNVLSAGVGQAPARQASLKGGIDINVPCTTINKVCSSGMKSIVFGSQSIALGHTDVVVAGGFESMSNSPHMLLGGRKGFGFGDRKLVDCISHDGLTDAFNNHSMGLCAQKTANDFKITREAQDEYCKMSYHRVIEANKNGIFKQQITPVIVKSKNGDQQINEDQEPKRYNQSKIPTLKPAFSKTGTITAANSSKINDGACAFVLMSEEKVKSLKVKPLAKIISYADVEIQPIDFSIAPHYATKKVLKKAGLAIEDIDYFQFNEAFAVVCLANMKLLDISDKKTNIYGGAVALGHPIGASGARIVQSLLTAFRNKGGKYGLAAICNGGGGSTSIIIQNLL